MKLTLDLYSDLTEEFIPLLDENLELTNRFMFSGKESLTALEKSIKKVKRILFEHLMNCDSSNCLRCSLVMKVKFEDGINVDMDLGNPCIEYITRWVLSSVKKVKIDIKEPLDTNVLNLLSRNPDFDDVHIDTKELKLHGVPLEKLLKAEFIKTNSLNTGCSKEELNDNLFAMKVGSGFESLENLELIIRGRDVFDDLQKIFKFFEFLNKKFTNLKLLILDHNEFHQLFYENDQGHFNFTPESFQDIVKYEEKLNVYNGRIKIKLKHCISFNVLSSPEEADEDYLETLKKELQTLGYLYCIKDYGTYEFKKSSNVMENFQLNIFLWLTHWTG
ncbi:hypothetical protein FO519_008448 [Halicephalobus sp. NKZ332]|nr:hypothetical protein FO519_008448 [Halicephalobus sp. NKZ332]